MLRMKWLFVALLSVFGIAPAHADWTIYIQGNGTNTPYSVQDGAVQAYFDYQTSLNTPANNGRCWRYYKDTGTSSDYVDASIVAGRYTFGCSWPAPSGNISDRTLGIAAPKLCTTTSSDERCRYQETRSNATNAGPVKCEGVVGCGDPFNPGTGNQYFVETDFEVPGSPLLTFTRVYNATPYAMVGNSLTAHWRHSFEYQLAALAGSKIQLRRPDGSMRSFTGTTPDAADEIGTLTALADGWTYDTGLGTVERYDTLGRLTRLSTVAGGYVDLTYPTNDSRLSKATDNFGRSLTFAYTGSTRLASVTTPDSKVYSFTYDTNSRLTKMTAPGAEVRTYIYDETTNNPSTYLKGMLTGVTDESNQRYATIKYNNIGQVVSNQRAGGADLLTVPTYAQTGTALKASTNATQTYAFTTVQGFEKVTSKVTACPTTTECLPQAESFAYDANGNMTSMTDTAGVKTCRAFDMTRNLETRRVEGLPTMADCAVALASPGAYVGVRMFETEWHPTFRLPAVTTGPLLRTEYAYDSKQNLTGLAEKSTSDAMGLQGLAAAVTSEVRNTASTYNAVGQVLTVTGPRTDVVDKTTFDYDTAGNLLTVTSSLGHVTTFAGYDAMGRPGTVTYPDGQVVAYGYDQRGRVLTMTSGTEVTTLTYFPTGLLQKSVLPSGVELTYTYDAAHRMTEVKDDLGNKVVLTLDAAGNVTAEKAYGSAGALQRSATAVFDALGRIKQATGAR